MSKKKEIKPDERIRIAQVCVKGTISRNAAAEQLEVHQSVVDDWVRQYESEGIEAFLPGGGNRRYVPAIKEAAVKDYLSGRGSLRDICECSARDCAPRPPELSIHSGGIEQSRRGR